MSNDVARLSVIGQILRRRWRLLVALAVVGAVLGIGASLLFSPGYQATSSVLLQNSRDEQELQTEAHLATSTVVLDRTAEALGWGVTGVQLRDSVAAQVLAGSVIEISGVARTPERAQQLADELTRQYVTFSNQLVSGALTASDEVLGQRRETLQQRINDTNRRIAELEGNTSPQARAERARLQTASADATRELEEITGRELSGQAAAALRQASIVVVEPAALPTSAAPPTLTQFMGGGALLLVLLGVFVNLLAARGDQRLRSTSEIAAALNAPVLGTVDVPDEPTAPPAGQPQLPGTVGEWLTSLWRSMRDDRPWDTWESAQVPRCRDELDRDMRYRQVLDGLRSAPGRILARLRGSSNTVLRLLVLVCDDDPTALRAAARLAVTAGTSAGPATVVTDRPDFADLAQSAVTAAGAGNPASTRNLRLTVRTSIDPVPSTPRTLLRVVEVFPTRPTLPDCGRQSGVLVVLTSGTRTGWELVGLADCCADAGHHLLGALVTSRTDPADQRSGGPTATGWWPRAVDGTAGDDTTGDGTSLAGSA